LQSRKPCPKKAVSWAPDVGKRVGLTRRRCQGRPPSAQLYDRDMADAKKEGTVGVLKAAELIKTVWPVIAPMAYARFLARGRGGVLIPVEAIKLRAGGEGIVDVDGRYVTEQDITSGKVNIPPDTVKEFAAYDPDREVVFLFDQGVGVATYRGGPPSGQATPKELYEKTPHP
jgi:hypothetical protein